MGTTVPALKVILRVLYTAFFVAYFLAASQHANYVSMVFSLFAGAIGFIDPAIWERKMPIGYWKMCVMNIVVLLAIAFAGG